MARHLAPEEAMSQRVARFRALVYPSIEGPAH
jgi:hypothetical protein